MDESNSKRGEGESDPFGNFFDDDFNRHLKGEYAKYLKTLEKEVMEIEPDDFPEQETEWAYLETRRPAPDFEQVAKTISDEELKYIFEEVLAKQDTMIPRQADDFLKLAASLKAFDPQRFAQYATRDMLSATKYYNLEAKLKEHVKSGQYQQFIRDAYYLKVLFPGDVDRINYDAIDASAWNKILNCLEEQKKGGYWRQFAELYSLAFELNPRKINMLMPVQHEWKKSLARFFVKGDLTVGQKMNFSSDMDTITMGEKDKQNFALTKKEWKNNLSYLADSVTRNTLAEIKKAKKTGGGFVNINTLTDPIYNTARCKYAIVKE